MLGPLKVVFTSYFVLKKTIFIIKYYHSTQIYIKYYFESMLKWPIV